MSTVTPESGRHTTLRAGDRVRHWSENYTGVVTGVQPMDEPLPDYCHVSTDDGKPVSVPHNQLLRLEPKPEPKAEPSKASKAEPAPKSP